MALQTDNLTMVGIGMLGDAPPNFLQPPLKDGIHLRWNVKRELAWPWYGFYLFRRLHHREGRQDCIRGLIAEMKVGQLSSTSLKTADGLFSSDKKLVLIDEFPPVGSPEFDLSGRSYLRFTLPPGNPVRYVEAKIGFRKGADSGQTCVDFQTYQEESGPNPFEYKDLVFEVFDHENKLLPNIYMNIITLSSGTVRGLNCGYRMEIRLPRPSSFVEITLVYFSRPGKVEALNVAGERVGVAGMSKDKGQEETITITGQDIASVVIHAPLDETFLLRVCFGVENRKKAVIQVSALSNATVVAEKKVAGKPGDIVTVSLEFDLITAVEFSSGPAALIDLCYVSVAKDALLGWELAPGFPAPMCLPVRHPDYPCSGGLPVDLAASEAVALGRITYGHQADWAGDPFKDLHGRLLKLVNGGPGGVPMSDPSRAKDVPGVPQTPDPGMAASHMPKQHPLDLVLLGTLHPAIAQMVGLYWVDTTVDPGKAYDYMITADNNNLGLGQILAFLNAEPGSGSISFSDFDAYIVHNKRLGGTVSLAPPTDLRVYVLPGATIAEQVVGGTLQDATNNAGLRWKIEVTDLGVLKPGQSIMYHVWRDNLGGGDTPAPAGDYKLVTKSGPILVVEPKLPPGVTPQYPTGWPPFSMYTIDKALHEGWYSYQVSGIDIFGRHSQNSTAGQWYQWTPAPDPVPWYYLNPPSDTVVYPSAVQLLDKIPPPAPTGVEAFALDPADPMLVRDAAYSAWWSALTASPWYEALSENDKKNLIGLRVRWLWTNECMRQAPDTLEFRIYYNSGTNPPGPDNGAAINWQSRFHVVGYNEHVTVTVDGTGKPLRIYEVFLPDPTGSFHEGVPLTPSLAEPIVYGNVGVSAADDKPHTHDAPKWSTGHWGGRFGNEGRLGPPAKVFRVLRTPPAPPVPPPADSERVYATPADYHSMSFYTYRWKPSDNLKTHIYRALDDSIFKADWAQRPRPALTTSQLQFFPDAAVEPRWDERKRQQVADELNQLNSFSHDAAGTGQAIAHYRQLSNDGLRVLAGLMGNEAVFTQLTITPLDPADPANADKKGPDNPASYVPDPSLRAYIDTLDGRSTNRYFYRSAYVDGAHNRSKLSLSSPPVYLPNVVPPRAPVITKILGGDRQVTIKWASNRESDLAEYRVYRAESEESSRDLRLMTLVHTEAVPAGDPAARPAEVVWPNDPVPGLETFYYRLVAVDTAGNISDPSLPVAGRAFDESLPTVPTLTVAWVSISGVMRARVSWTSTDETLLQRRQGASGLWTNLNDWVSPGAHTVTDSNTDSTQSYQYRLRVRKTTGATAIGGAVTLAALP